MLVNVSAVQLWANALRSGNYPQGKGYLNQNGKFCVWGIACEVAIANGQKLDKQMRQYPKSILYAYNGHSAVAPNIVQRWLGIKDDARIESPFEAKSLLGLSDNGTPFVLLADIIESNYIKGTTK